jgi:hypothetical protein
MNLAQKILAIKKEDLLFIEEWMRKEREIFDKPLDGLEEICSSKNKAWKFNFSPMKFDKRRGNSIEFQVVYAASPESDHGEIFYGEAFVSSWGQVSVMLAGTRSDNLSKLELDIEMIFEESLEEDNEK